MARTSIAHTTECWVESIAEVRRNSPGESTGFNIGEMVKGINWFNSQMAKTL
jgi:hypothetical protein